VSPGPSAGRSGPQIQAAVKAERSGMACQRPASAGSLQRRIRGLTWANRDTLRQRPIGSGKGEDS
jgi:hypothetical protein